MPKLAISHLVVFTAALAACATGPESEPDPSGALETPDDAGEEPVGESQDPSLLGLLCGGLCAVAGGIECAFAAETCATATTVTVGTTIVPCAIAVGAACLGTLACMAFCSYDTPGID